MSVPAWEKGALFFHAWRRAPASPCLLVESVYEGGCPSTRFYIHEVSGGGSALAGLGTADYMVVHACGAGDRLLACCNDGVLRSVRVSDASGGDGGYELEEEVLLKCGDGLVPSAVAFDGGAVGVATRLLGEGEGWWEAGCALNEWDEVPEVSRRRIEGGRAGMPSLSVYDMGALLEARGEYVPPLRAVASFPGEGRLTSLGYLTALDLCCNEGVWAAAMGRSGVLLFVPDSEERLEPVQLETPARCRAVSFLGPYLAAGMDAGLELDGGVWIFDVRDRPPTRRHPWRRGWLPPVRRIWWRRRDLVLDCHGVAGMVDAACPDAPLPLETMEPGDFAPLSGAAALEDEPPSMYSTLAFDGHSVLYFRTPEGIFCRRL